MDTVQGSARRGLRLAWYRFASTFRTRRGGYLAVVLLIGLLGGMALASAAAARRTASSPTVFLASTNASDLVGITGVLNASIASAAYDPGLLRRIARLPHVEQVESTSGIDFLPLGRDGAPLHAPNFYQPSAGNGYGSVDGLYFNQDKVVVTRGRMADPRRADELMLTADAAAALYVHLGSVLPIGIYTNDQTELPGFGTAAVRPIRVVDEKVVGFFVFPSTIVHDDVDAGNGPNNLLTPALTRSVLGCCANYTETGVRVSGGAREVAVVQGAINHLLPIGFPHFADLQPELAKAQRTVKPESIALGVFAGIVALATLLIVGQLLGRLHRMRRDERQLLRSLGAGPATTMSDGLPGLFAAVVAGSLLAAIVAVALSPLAPLGPYRPVYPDPGVSLDWTALGAGVGLLILALGALLALLGLRFAPHRRRGSEQEPERPSRLVSAASTSGVPVPAATGIRFALQPGNGARTVPVRSTMLGAVLAVAVIVATVTFGASLDALVTHPALYGWNWDYMLSSGGDIPEQQATALLDHDHDVAAWSGLYTVTLELDGQSVPLLGERPGAAVTPPTLTGHGLERSDQVVLGAVTMAELHKHVGNDVTLSSGILPPARLHIVGTAAMPTIGSSDPRHTEMGTGALIDDRLIPAIDRNPFADPITGPNAILVRVRPGLSRADATRSLSRIAQATSNTANFGVTVTGVLRPAEIVNYRSLGLTPLYLGIGLAAGAAAALGLTLLASVRARRHDLAVLKTVGFTRGQLASAIAWQSTVTVGLGAAIGVPLGIALGRWLWDLFARNIHAVPAPTVPVLVVTGIAAGALALANVVGFAPGRLAARTPAASLLHSE